MVDSRESTAVPVPLVRRISWTALIVGLAVAAGVSKAANSAFFLLLLGAVAAAVGGFLSTRSLIAEAAATLPIATRSALRTS